MRVKVRILLLASAVACTLALSASAAYASFGIEKFVAVNCKVETCAQTTTTIAPFGTYYEPKEPTAKEEEEKKEGFTQAGGRVPFGITDFKVKTEGTCRPRNPKESPSRTSGPTWPPDWQQIRPHPKHARRRSSRRQKKPPACSSRRLARSEASSGTTKPRSTREASTSRLKGSSTTSNPKKATRLNSASLSTPRLSARGACSPTPSSKATWNGARDRPCRPSTSELGPTPVTTTTTSKSKSLRHSR